MKYKRIVLGLTSLMLISTLVLSVPKAAQAACKCEPTSVVNVTPPIIDSEGNVIPSEALGIWTSSGDEPHCPGYNEGTPVADKDKPKYDKDVKKSPFEGKECNVYTQTYFNTPFKVPTLGDLLGNVIRLFFFIASLFALIQLLLGGFQWVSSGGDEKKLEAARKKITSALLGLVVMVAVLTLVIVMEQVIFGGKVCLGVSCPINLGGVAIVK